jgi:hypothetical protein
MLVPIVSASSSRGRSCRDIVLCAASRVGSPPANCRGRDQSRRNHAQGQMHDAAVVLDEGEPPFLDQGDDPFCRLHAY